MIEKNGKSIMNALKRENLQRNYILNGLTEAQRRLDYNF